MNATASRELRDIARKLAPQGTSVVARQGVTQKPIGKGKKRRYYPAPFLTLRNVGYRAIYQALKRAYKSVPRPARRAWLDEQWASVA